MRPALPLPHATTLLYLAKTCPDGFVSCGTMARDIYNEGGHSTPYGRARVLRTLYGLEEGGLLERGPRGKWRGGRLTKLGRTRALVEELMPMDARPKQRRRNPRIPHAAAREGRTRNPKTVVRDFSNINVLKEGRNNSKIGFMVAKGHLRGYAIYSLTLEERATCARHCQRYLDCYGNSMAFAQRMAHGPALEAKIAAELETLVAGIRNPSKRGRAGFRPRGLLIRLHVLGDFYSPDYVSFWASMLHRYREVSVFGYTAWQSRDKIGARILEVRQHYADLFGVTRFNIRFSGSRPDMPGNATWYGPGTGNPTPPDGSFACPEQLGRVASCATCAACWEGTKTVAFKLH